MLLFGIIPVTGLYIQPCWTFVILDDPDFPVCQNLSVWVLFLLTKSLHAVSWHAQSWWWCIQSCHPYSLEWYWVLLNPEQTQSWVGASSTLSILLGLHSFGHFAPVVAHLCSPFLNQIVRRDIVEDHAKWFTKVKEVNSQLSYNPANKLFHHWKQSCWLNPIHLC